MVTNVDNLNKENLRTPLSFKNPLFNNPKIDEKHQSIPTDSSDDDEDDDEEENLVHHHQQNSTNFNLNQTDSSKALYFVNSLCIESQRDPSSPSQPLIHTTSRQSLLPQHNQHHHQQQQQQQQQPLFVLNSGYLTRSTQSLSSTSNNNNGSINSRPLTASTYYCLKTNEDSNGITKRQSILPSQSAPPKMGLKALNHSSSNKVRKH